MPCDFPPSLLSEYTVKVTISNKITVTWGTVTPEVRNGMVETKDSLQFAKRQFILCSARHLNSKLLKEKTEKRTMSGAFLGLEGVTQRCYLLSDDTA